jgi:glycosyltransferase involved in cell wall biosynthesis
LYRRLGLRWIAAPDRGFQRHAWHGVSGEVIAADNGSTDGSIERGRGIACACGQSSHSRYGAALAAGIEAANGRYIIMGDSDESYDFSALSPFIEKLREGYDLVMGNRYLGSIALGAMPPMHRYFGNPLLTALGRLFFACKQTRLGHSNRYGGG